MRRLGDRSDPAATAVAKLVIEFTKAGQRDPERLSSLGCSRRILRADRASARTECPASRPAFTVSRPIPLLAPMIRTFATASCSQFGPAWLTSCAVQAAAPQDGRAD